MSVAMSSVVSVLDPSLLEGLGRGLELMSTAGTSLCDKYI